jgi:hypothetical protein
MGKGRGKDRGSHCWVPPSPWCHSWPLEVAPLLSPGLAEGWEMLLGLRLDPSNLGPFWNLFNQLPECISTWGHLWGPVL